jgi:hypothetical protein
LLRGFAFQGHGFQHRRGLCIFHGRRRRGLFVEREKILHGYGRRFRIPTSGGFGLLRGFALQVNFQFFQSS